MEINNKNISYFQWYINKTRDINYLKYCVDILNSLYAKYPNIKQINDVYTNPNSIKDYLEIFNNNLKLYDIKNIDYEPKINDLYKLINFSWNEDNMVQSGGKMKINNLLILIIEASFHKKPLYIKMTKCPYRMDSVNFDYEQLNNTVAIDIDYKVAFNEFKIDPYEMYINIVNWLLENCPNTFLYGEMSRSLKGYHFFFNGNIPKNKDGINALLALADIAIRHAFTKLGYSKVIYYPGVFDSCTKSLSQGIYLTANNFVVNNNFTGKWNEDYIKFKDDIIEYIKAHRFNELESLNVYKYDDNIRELFRDLNIDDIIKMIHDTRFYVMPNRTYRWICFSEFYSVLVGANIFTEDNLKQIWTEFVSHLPIVEHPLQYYITEPYRLDWNKKKQNKKTNPYTLKNMGLFKNISI